MEPSCLHQYTEPKSRNIMSEAIKKKIHEAKEKLANGGYFVNQAQGDLDLFKWLEICLERAKKRKHNDVLVHLATIGKAMEANKEKTIGLTIYQREVRIALFLAQAFEDISAIWYLEDLMMETLRHTKEKELNRIVQEIKSESKKRTREEDKDETERKKPRLIEFEVDPDFEDWLKGDRKFLEGLEEA